MSACAYCLRFTAGRADTCQFPGSDVCRSERRLEDMAYAIEAQKRSDGALSRYCQVCRACPNQPCVNTIKPGEPLPGRAYHYARLTNVPAAEKETGGNDACY